MTRARAVTAFVIVLVLALILLCPLSVGVAASGIGRAGLSARVATGTIWSGKLSDAYFGPVPLGDLDVALRPFPLFVGRAELGIVGTSGAGRLIGGAAGPGVGEVSAKLSLGQSFAPLPLDIVDLSDVTVRFDNGRCSVAEGRVRATFTGDVGGLGLSSGLSGAVRCNGGDLMLPLTSQSGTQRLVLQINAHGRWHAVMTVRVSDPAVIVKLGAAGYRPVAGGYVLRAAGTI